MVHDFPMRGMFDSIDGRTFRFRRQHLPRVLKEDSFDWVAITSPEAASVFLDAWSEAGKPKASVCCCVKCLGQAKVAVEGHDYSGTWAQRGYGIHTNPTLRSPIGPYCGSWSGHWGDPPGSRGVPRVFAVKGIVTLSGLSALQPAPVPFPCSSPHRPLALS